jgi:N6-adenosine-specific RNA methylase IME4
VTRYRTIVCDPPWPMKDSGVRTAATGGQLGADGEPLWNRHRRTAMPYARMSIEEIAGLPVPDLADPQGAHLYLWTFGRYVPAAFEIAATWGFRFSALLTWCKTPMGLGLGGAFVPSAEHILFARRGTLAHLGRQPSTWWQWKRPYIGVGGPTHSAKPEAFLDLVEQVSPGPYLEMFARRARFGWDYHGDQSLGTAQMPGEAA